MKIIDAEYIIKKYNEGTTFSPQVIQEAQKTLLSSTPVNYNCKTCNNEFYTVQGSPEHEKQLCYTCLIELCCQ